MRALIVLVGLVATPFLAGVSQVRTNNGQGHDVAHCAARTAQRPGTAINKCDPPPVVNPPPVVDPPPVVNPPPVVKEKPREVLKASPPSRLSGVLAGAHALHVARAA